MKAVAAALTAHADLVYDQVRWRLGDGPRGGADRHADIVHDTFMIATAVATPPAQLRAWLVALTRNECLRVLLPRADRTSAAADGDPRAPAHIALATQVPDPPWPSRHPGAGLGAEDLRPLVAWAADGLDGREREIIELGLRHGLDPDELGLALGVPARARRLRDRLAAEFLPTLGALVLARSGAGQCPRLQHLVDRWNSRYTPAWRSRLRRHVDRCGHCRFARKLHVDPVGILQLPEPARLPRTVRRWVLADAADPMLAGERAALLDRAGPWQGAFPVPLDERARLHRWKAGSAPSAAPRPASA